MIAKQNTQYHKAKTKIAEMIETLRRDSVFCLPKEPELIERLGVGRNTTRKVISELVAKGELETVQGRGTFIVRKFKDLHFSNWIDTELAPQLFLAPAIRQFESVQKDIHIHSTALPYDTYIAKLMNLLLHEHSPDVVQLTPFWLQYLKHLELFQPLDRYIDQHIVNRRYATAFELGKIDRNVYALNWTLCPLVLFYNKRVLETVGLDPDHAPETIDELTEMCLKISRAPRRDLHAICLPLAFYVFSFSCLYLFLLSFGGGFSNAIGNIIIDCEENIRALTWLSNLFEQGSLKKEQHLNGARVLFASDRLAFMIDGPPGRGHIRQLSGIGRDFDSHYGVAKMPIGPSGRSESVLHTHSLAISSHCAFPEEAYRWINFLANDEGVARAYFEQSGMIPCNRDVLHKPFYFSDPFASVLIEQVETASKKPIEHPLFIKSLPFVLQTISSIVFEGCPPAEGLKFLQKIIHMIGQASSPFYL